MVFKFICKKLDYKIYLLKYREIKRNFEWCPKKIKIRRLTIIIFEMIIIKYFIFKQTHSNIQSKTVNLPFLIQGVLN